MELSGTILGWAAKFGSIIRVEEANLTLGICQVWVLHIDFGGVSNPLDFVGISLVQAGVGSLVVVHLVKVVFHEVEPLGAIAAWQIDGTLGTKSTTFVDLSSWHSQARPVFSVLGLVVIHSGSQHSGVVEAWDASLGSAQKNS
jgi:hypothetical protein